MSSRSFAHLLSFFTIVLALGAGATRASAQDADTAPETTAPEATATVTTTSAPEEPEATVTVTTTSAPVETTASDDAPIASDAERADTTERSPLIQPRTAVPAEAPAEVTVAAPEPREVRPHHGEAEAVVDSFWGLQLRGRGALAVHEQVDLTVHAAMFVNPALSRGGGFDDLWVEAGVGARAVLLDAALLVGGEVGITGGSMLSDGSRGMALDGLALRAIADLRLPLVENVVGLDGYAQLAFYTPIRQESGETRTLLHTLARAGAYLFDFVGLGLYFEQLHARIPNASGGTDTYNWVTWLGGYVETRFDFGLVVGTAMGAAFDLDRDADPIDFYRVWLGWRG